MVSSSALNPSKSKDEEFTRFDEMISELYSLKSLYGLLHNNTVESSQSSTCALDEKSWHLLKKLLDGAAQEALQPIAKTVACSLEPGQILANKLNSASSPHSDFQKEAKELEKYRECHSSALLEPPVAVCIPTAQTKIIQTACPSVDQPVHPRQQSKEDPICLGLIDVSDSPEHRLMSRMSESNDTRKSINQSDKTLISHRINGADRPAPNPDNGGELLTPVHALKRARVDQVDLPTRLSNRAPKTDQIDCELIHQKRIGRKETTEPINNIVLTQTRRKEPGTKPNRDRSTRRTPSSKHQDSIVLAGDRAAQIICKNDRWAENRAPGPTKKHIESHQKGSKAKGRFHSLTSSKSARCSSNSFSQSARSAHSTHPKHEKRAVTKNKKMEMVPTAKARANKSMEPVRFTGQEMGTYSSSSYSSRMARSSILTWRKQKQEKKTRNIGRKRLSPSPTKPVTSHLSLIPHRKSSRRKLPPDRKLAKVRVERGAEEEGKLKKLKNKLAIIFHHNHHHHHHLHKSEEDEKGTGFGQKEHERSLWKYLKGVLHRNRGKREEHGHNLHLMIEWFFNNLWGMRRHKKKKKKMKKPRAGKKLKWWEWFKRRRGVVVGGGCRQRNRLLRLRFNGSHRPTANRDGVATSKR